MRTRSLYPTLKAIRLTLINLLLICSLAQAQQLEPTSESSALESYDFHIQKYRKNQTLGIINLAAGGVFLITGMVISFDDALWDAMGDAFVDGEGEADLKINGFMIGGVCASLASIPFFMKANEHKKKANLLLGTSQSTLNNNHFKSPKNIGITLVIPID
ncbi:hypothetical protein [Aestuariivivens sediminicola]|uniref:hypothetical protein n=1 Tax=Aestuariivivens sediminicola TaxID=2913560 RepID=UPI001F56A2C8|nr:hypothetical protein [Aestuariivivens sediminicola]